MSLLSYGEIIHSLQVLLKLHLLLFLLHYYDYYYPSNDYSDTVRRRHCSGMK